MTRLGELIELSQARNRLSYERAAQRASERQAPISSSWISQAKRGLKTITPQMVRGIAAAFDIPVEDVVRAALTDIGFPLPDYAPTVESSVRRDVDLSIEAKSMLLAAISAARASANHTELTDWGALGGGENAVSDGSENRP